MQPVTWERVRRQGLLTALVLLAVMGAGCRKSTPWSPDSRHVALEIGGDIRLYDTQTGVFRRLVPGEAGKHEAAAPSWSSDSHTLAYFDCRLDGDQGTASLVSLDTATGKAITLVAGIHAPARDADDPLSTVRDPCSLAWSPDGREIAYVAPEGDTAAVWVVNAAGGVPRRLTRAGWQGSIPAWSPDSKSLACATAPAGPDVTWQLEITDRDGMGRRTLCQAPQGTELGSGLQWAADAKTGGVFFHPSQSSEASSRTCEAYLVTIADGSLKQLATIPAPAWTASFTHDLQSVLYLHEVEDGATRVGTVAILGAPYRTPRLLPHPDHYGDASMTVPMLSPDGKTVSLILRDGEKPPLLGLRYLDGRAPVDITIGG